MNRFAINRRNHVAYKQALTGIPGIHVLDYDPAERNSHHYIVIEADATFPFSRDAIVAALQAENIPARKNFWPGCHRMQPHRDLFPHAGMMLRHTEALAEKIVVLPNGTSMDAAVVEAIGEVISVLSSR